MSKRYLYPAIFIGFLIYCFSFTAHASCDEAVEAFLSRQEFVLTSSSLYREKLHASAQLQPLLEAEKATKKQKQDIEAKLEDRWLQDTERFQYLENMKKLKKQPADAWLAFARSVSKGEIEGLDQRLAPIFAYHSIFFMMDCIHHKRSEPYRIATAELCLTQMQQCKETLQKIRWARRALQILPLNFELITSSYHYANMEVVYSSALKILFALKNPLSQLQSFRDLPDMNEPFGLNVKFPKGCILTAQVNWYIAGCYQKLVIHCYDKDRKNRGVAKQSDIIQQYEKEQIGHIQKVKAAYENALDHPGKTDTEILLYWKIALAMLNYDIGLHSIKYDQTGRNGDLTLAQPFFNKSCNLFEQAAQGYEALANVGLAILNESNKPGEKALELLILAANSYCNALNFEKSLELSRMAWTFDADYCRNSKTFRLGKPRSKFLKYPGNSLVVRSYINLKYQEHPEWQGKIFFLDQSTLAQLYVKPERDEKSISVQPAEVITQDFQNGYQEAQAQAYQDTLEMARKMLAMLDVTSVANITGLTPDIVESLK